MFSIGEYYGWMFFLSCWLSMIKHKAILHGGFRPHAHNHCEREERKLNFPHLSHSTSLTTGNQLNCWGVLEWELKSTWAAMRKLISTFQLLVGGGDHFEILFFSITWSQLDIGNNFAMRVQPNNRNSSRDGGNTVFKISLFFATFHIKVSCHPVQRIVVGVVNAGDTLIIWTCEFSRLRSRKN